MDRAYVRPFDPKARPKLEKMPSEYLNYVKKWKAEPDHWGGTISYANFRFQSRLLRRQGAWTGKL